jgi:hypothetical protein
MHDLVHKGSLTQNVDIRLFAIDSFVLLCTGKIGS